MKTPYECLISLMSATYPTHLITTFWKEDLQILYFYFLHHHLLLLSFSSGSLFSLFVLSFIFMLCIYS